MQANMSSTVSSQHKSISVLYMRHALPFWLGMPTKDPFRTSRQRGDETFGASAPSLDSKLTTSMACDSFKSREHLYRTRDQADAIPLVTMTVPDLTLCSTDLPLTASQAHHRRSVIGSTHRLAYQGHATKSWGFRPACGHV